MKKTVCLSYAYILTYSFDKMSGYSSYDGIRFYIFCHYGPCPYNGIVTDGYALQNRGIGTYPYIFPQHNRSRISMGTVLGRQPVIQSGKNYVMSYLTTVANGYPSMILEMAAGIDEYILTHLNILSEIGIERWKYAQAIGYRLSEQFR